MQHYIHLGLGFSATLLSTKECDDIYFNSQHDIDGTDIGLKIIPFTENYEGNKWATVVVKDLEEIKHSGKLSYIDDIINQSKKLTLNSNQTLKLQQLLQEFGIERHLNNIKPIIYSDNY